MQCLKHNIIKFNLLERGNIQILVLIFHNRFEFYRKFIQKYFKIYF